MKKKIILLLLSTAMAVTLLAGCGSSDNSASTAGSAQNNAQEDVAEACIEYSKFASDDYLKNAQKYAHDMIGNMNHGMNGFYDWNIVLDETGGPNHVGNFCDATLLYDTKKKELIRRNTADYLWHFTHFIKPGAVRIGISSYSDELEATAFLNPDNQIAVVLLNRTGRDIRVNIRLEDKMAEIRVKRDSIATAVLD